MREYTVPKETGLITAKQAADLTGRSAGCISHWEKLGYIHPTYWMGRKYYEEAQFFKTGQRREGDITQGERR